MIASLHAAFCGLCVVLYHMKVAKANNTYQYMYVVELSLSATIESIISNADATLLVPKVPL